MHEGPFSLHLWLHLISFVFLTIVIPISMRQHLITVLICTFLMISDVEYIFIYPLVICMSSLEKKMSIQILCPFLKSVSLIFFYYYNGWDPHVLDINSLSDLWFANIFPNTSCLFTMMKFLFVVQKHLDIVHLYIFAFDFWAFGVRFKKLLPTSRIFLSVVSSSFYSIKYYI